MAITVNSLSALNQYLSGVMERADHHAANVNEIVLAIAGAIIWKVADDVVHVREYNGAPANMLWMTINGTRYAFSYNHSIQTIELKKDGMNGPVVASFTNATPILDVKTIFNKL